ncbi:MAG: glycosyltransferase family 2 protein [Saccharolobus sp.]
MFNLLLNLVIFIIPSIAVWNQIIFYLFGKNEDYIRILNNVELPKLSVIIPTKGERIDVIQGAIDSLSKAKWDKHKLEIIIVSDDDEKYFNELLTALKIPSNLVVKIYRREKKVGYKSGALTYGLEKSTGDLILTLDVDARIDEDSLIKAYLQMVSLGCDAITMEWHGYSKNLTSLSRALMVSTVLTSKSILKGRDKLGLKVLPIGCGTIYKRRALEEVNGWDPKMIQDDYELGVRLLQKGFRICASSSPVFVEVPDNLVAFYVQQSRWAMGTMEVLIRRIKYIIKSNIKLYQKLEIIMYLSQYIPIILTFIGAFILSFSRLLGYTAYSVDLSMFLIWAITLSAYVYIFINTARKLGLDPRNSIMALGRLSAYTVAISPYLLISTIKAFKRNRKYIVTPKGKAIKSNIGYPMLVFGILFLFSSILYLIQGNLLTFIWLMYYSLPYIYSFIAFIKGL